METKKVRVRFAPSPTGGLHLGGVRTALYNYLFARHMGGEFILRIEDTDRTRYVQGAEEYIFDCLKWCGIEPDESVIHGGDYGPYRQSDRKEIYQQYAQQLIDSGHAYYAFDTPEALEKMRAELANKENPSPKYDQRTRLQMTNSLTLSEEETRQRLANKEPHVIRLKVPANYTLEFTDLIRGNITHDTNTVDDKVLMKADGMPTYHLAATVDDYLMKITHIFRGEEWLPSLPFHVLLWRYLGWEEQMPQWVHLPLILKPSGKGKLSKRDGEKQGFPVFAMDWKDPVTGEITNGFKERGFLPEAFDNLLALLGWSSGTEQEIFSLEELVQNFTLEKVHKAGARFDYEKAKWYNQQHLLATDNARLAELSLPFFKKEGLEPDSTLLAQAIGLIKERCHLLTDLVPQSRFFFEDPKVIDTESLQKKWNGEVAAVFEKWLLKLDEVEGSNGEALHDSLQILIKKAGLKGGAVMMPLRIFLVGGKFGPGVFDIAAFIGKEATKKRVKHGLSLMA